MAGKDITKILKDSAIYFDPRLFIHILEEFSKANIVLISNKNNPDGEIILPRHVNYYYRNRLYNYTYYVLENTKNIKYRYGDFPRCELIVKKTSRGYVDKFTLNESKLMLDVVSKLNRMYINTIKLPSFTDIDFKDVLLVSQTIDKFGKTYAINIHFNPDEDKNVANISLLTSPVQPLKLPEVPLINNSVDIKLAHQLFEYLDIKSVYQNVNSNGTLKEIGGKLGTANILVKISEGNIPIQDIPINIIQDPPSGSLLENYSKNKKLSRYITEYTYWKFAKSDGNIENFTETGFIIIRNHTYPGIVSEKFDENSPIINDGKIVVTTEKMLQQLISTLKLKLKRKPSIVNEYKTLIYIPNYYMDVTDFKKNSQQFIFIGEELIHRPIYQLHNNIQLGIYKPYYLDFKNNIYIAQHHKSLGSALKNSSIWNKYKYNNSIYNKDKPIPNDSFTLYRIKNMKPAQPVIVDGSGDPSSDINIAGYKYENSSFYISLLDI
jgi:hypothetical protein